MGHVAVLAQPVVFVLLCIKEVAVMVKDSASGLLTAGLLVHHLLGNEHVPVLVIGLALVIHEEIDTGGKEVDSGSLKELVAATASFLLPLL